MTRLDDLIISLTTILVCYHDSQTQVVKPRITEDDKFWSKSRQYAIDLLNEADYVMEIDKLNKACTSHYTGRLHFLDFIKDTIIDLKTKQNKDTPFDDNELEVYTKDIARLFIDFRELLKIPKSKHYDVQFKEVHGKTANISLPGLIDDSYTRSFTNFISSNKEEPLCNSGKLTTKILLDRFNIKATSSNEEMHQIAKILCQEHQDSLLAKENQKIKAELEQSQHKVAEQQSTNEKLTRKIAEQQSANEELNRKLAEQQSTNIELNRRIVEQQSLIKSLELRVAEQQSTNEALAHRIAEKLEEEPSKAQSSATAPQVKPNKEKALPTPMVFKGLFPGLRGTLPNVPSTFSPYQSYSVGLFMHPKNPHTTSSTPYRTPSQGGSSNGE
ncbi:coiled-coil domain-containing protein [Legionella drancourtii]|uniref:Uncharacterized protein n=1 Tax=Legionella drancourtii LLAP12 TaxID=658187 RepID=G9EMJ3_9GAMM|nr:hypothetical protein [Legionella drancourtii]EHL31529.1 hypothetical protein LDG_6460 [Legionella drancourtii LLAP12]